MNVYAKLALPGVAALMIGGAVACGPATPVTPPPPATSSAAAPATTAPAPAPAPATTAPAPAPSAPSMTGSQQQAVTSAQGYLTDGQGFSRDGLLKQLTSSYGEGFSTADAVFALNYLHPDWNAQAAISAKGYVADGQGFSRSGLIQQLTSSYGEGFTYSQAVYGVTQAGL